MKLAQKLLVGILTIVFSLGVVTPAFARGYDSRHDGWNNDSSRRSSYGWWNKYDRDGSRSRHDKDKHHDNDEKTCEERQAKLDAYVEKLNGMATTYQTRTDILYAGVGVYVTDNNLTVENYDELNANADSFKNTSAANIEALVAMDPQVNCDDPEDKTQQNEYREQFKLVVGGLRDYHHSLKELVNAVIEAATAEPEEETDA